MTFSITEIKEDLAGIGHGTNTDKVTNLNGLIERAGRQVLSKIDPAETIRKEDTTLYDQVYDYSAPSDLKKNKVLDLRPQVSRDEKDNLSQTLSEEFDLRKEEARFHVQQESGTKTIRISKAITPAGVTIHQFNDTTSNGTWAVGDDATNLTQDKNIKVKGSASLNFDLDGSTTSGYIENSTMSQVDLSDHDEISSIFLWVYLPNASAITNVILRWGNDGSNYWSRTVTTPHNKSAFATGWNLLRFDWNGATETGTVAPATIDYSRVTITYDGTADTDFRVDQMWSTIGQPWEIWYYSKFMFRTSAGIWGEDISANTDLINLDTDAYNILVNQSAYFMAQQQQGENSAADVQFFFNELFGVGNEGGMYSDYQSVVPSETNKPTTTYYRIR